MGQPRNKDRWWIETERCRGPEDGRRAADKLAKVQERPGWCQKHLPDLTAS